MRAGLYAVIGAGVILALGVAVGQWFARQDSY